MKHLNRCLYAAVGVTALLFAGLVYAWTVLQAPIAKMYPNWTTAQMSLTFTITMACFCFGGLAGGILQKKHQQPRLLMWIAAILFPIGFFITAKSQSLLMLYLGFGILGGFATGIAYNAVMSAVSCWFPDKQGFISGVLLMGFGISSFLVGKIYTALTPNDGSGAWRSSFMFMGVVLFVVMATCGFFTVKPDAEWMAPVSSKEKTIAPAYEEIGTGEMLRRPSFWLYMVWATFLTAAGLAIISQGTPMALEACPELNMGSVATIVGLISIFNGIGRIVFGASFDGLGNTKTMVLGGTCFAAAMALLLAALKTHDLALLVAAYIVTGLSYGCVPPTNAAFINKFYGRSNYPANLSVVNMNVLVASFGSTIAGSVYDATNSYVSIILIVLALIAVSTLISLFIKVPVHE